jgi:erythromycin esterase-like protein
MIDRTVNLIRQNARPISETAAADDALMDFIDGLRQYNDNLSENSRKVGFYGLDLYSLYTSIAAVLQYLDRIQPEPEDLPETYPHAI